MLVLIAFWLGWRMLVLLLLDGLPYVVTLIDLFEPLLFKVAVLSGLLGCFFRFLVW